MVCLVPVGTLMDNKVKFKVIVWKSLNVQLRSLDSRSQLFRSSDLRSHFIQPTQVTDGKPETQEEDVTCLRPPSGWTRTRKGTLEAKSIDYQWEDPFSFL